MSFGSICEINGVNLSRCDLFLRHGRLFVGRVVYAMTVASRAVSYVGLETLDEFRLICLDLITVVCKEMNR